MGKGALKETAGDEGNSGGSLYLYIQRAGGLLGVQEGEVLGGDVKMTGLGRSWPGWTDPEMPCAVGLGSH